MSEENFFSLYFRKEKQHSGATVEQSVSTWRPTVQIVPLLVLKDLHYVIAIFFFILAPWRGALLSYSSVIIIFCTHYSNERIFLGFLFLLWSTSIGGGSSFFLGNLIIQTCLGSLVLQTRSAGRTPVKPIQSFKTKLQNEANTKLSRIGTSNPGQLP